MANGWSRLTVLAIILGTVVGGALINENIAYSLLSFDFPVFETPVDSVITMALSIITGIYLLAALFNLYIPETKVDHVPLSLRPIYLFREFNHCLNLLWRDKLGQISLATTTLFWGAGATLQFIVIRWAADALGYDLAQASMLQGVTAIGVAAGAAMAARMITLRKSVRVIPMGIAMGIIVIVMNFVTSFWVAVPLLITIGALSGFFVVPHERPTQHRGHILMGAGHSMRYKTLTRPGDFGDDGSLCPAHLAEFQHLYRHCLIWAVCGRHDVLGQASFDANQRIHDASHLDDCATH
jgi:hypothetical protein